MGLETGQNTVMNNVFYTFSFLQQKKTVSTFILQMFLLKHFNAT